MNTISAFCDINVGKRDFDVNKSCRVCLSHVTNMINIFEETNNEIMDKIEFCTGIQLKEEKGLPSNICSKCVNELSIAYKFKAICILSNQTLQEIHSMSIKVESPDNNEDRHIDNYCCDLKETEDETDACFSLQKEKCQPIKKIKGQNKDKQSKTENKKITKRGPYKNGGCPRLRKYKFRKLTCELCNLKFPSKEESDKHKKDLHVENISWMCEVCGKTFAHRGSLYTHARSHLPPRYACEHCDYSSGLKYDLEKHLRIHLGVKRYACAVCPARFHTTSNLRAHERRTHGPPARAHACTACGRRFADRSKLESHVDSHYDIKRFKCEVCLERFTRRCHWKKHMEKQHAVSVPPQRPGRRPTRLTLGGQLQ